jgi:hypothetical protein
MRKLLKRWYVWLGLVLLMGLPGSMAVILAKPSRITQANLDRIHEGMNRAEVTAILGDGEKTIVSLRMTVTGVIPAPGGSWHDGPNWITILFDNGKVSAKEIHLATPWETLHWYAKMGAAKIGVKWD